MSNTIAEQRARLCEDIITGAVEGGTGYWAQISHYQWVDHLRDDELVVTVADLDDEPDRQDTYAVLHELDETSEAGYAHEGMVLDVAKLEGAFKGLLRAELSDIDIRFLGDSHRVRLLAAYFDPENADLDANDYDTLAQLALLGEIRYG